MLVFCILGIHQFISPMFKRLFFLFTILAILSACKTKQKLDAHALSTTHKISFLDSLTASNSIIKDDVEHFFDHVGLLDMSIQMKRNMPAAMPREKALADYKQFLKTEVLDFTPEDISFINEVFEEVFKLSNQVSKDIFPSEIKLIKTHGNHYGSTAYYTRENCIVIPKFVLSIKNKNAFMGTMFHELFHIYSRYNPEKRKQLYKLIGFENIGNFAQLDMPDSLQKRVLLNPDGINFAYAIDLKTDEGKAFQAIPIILANQFGYVGSKPLFFNYLEFGLFEVKRGNEKIQVLSNSDGSSYLDLRELPDFRKQIKDNTDYIIHPDEVLADNFMFLMSSLQIENYTDRFKPEGQQLINDMKDIIAQ